MAKNLLFSLPEFVIQHIWEFSPEKREYWDNLTEQFMKGGFYRTNLRSDTYLNKQSQNTIQFWNSTRPSMRFGPGSQYSFNKVSQWDIKTKKAEFRMGVTNKPNWLGHLITSSLNPVSKWCKNILKWETVYPEHCKYLSKNKVILNIPMKSKFYIDRHKKRVTKKKRQKKRRDIQKIQKKRLIVFQDQLENWKYGLKVNQLVYIGFVDYISHDGIKQYRGIIDSIVLPRISLLPKTFDVNIIDVHIEKLTKIEIFFPEDRYRKSYCLGKIFHLVVKACKDMTNKLFYWDEILRERPDVCTDDQIEYFKMVISKRTILLQQLEILTSSLYFQKWIENNWIELE